ncbi:hypothetical protein [uncultured Variovorax sp.]|uniref:hypothetical protein n=1 Tax=uncultured Variovorax sp. TaxID=114708 RepID=UPI0025D75DAA|nr:hypothetical protein [uncultured Variovorax sp.]
MSAAQHTPGPWTVKSWAGSEHIIPEIWCQTDDEFSDAIRNAADARLAAAAPDLLAGAVDAHAFHKAEGDRAEREGRPEAVKLHRFLAAKLEAGITKASGGIA